MAPRFAALAAAAVFALAASTASADSSALYSMLAPAPTQEWVESSMTATTLDGPFDAHAYADYLQALAPDSPRMEQILRNLTFEMGYSRAWVQAGSNDALTERVFQFRDPGGAGAWYASLQRQNQGTKYLLRRLPALESNPNSFGVVLKGPDGMYSYRVEFLIATLVFTVHMDSAKNDLSDQALKQALTESHVQPPVRVQPAPTVAHATVPRLNLLPLIAALAGAGFIVAVISKLVVRRRRVRGARG